MRWWGVGVPPSAPAASPPSWTAITHGRVDVPAETKVFLCGDDLQVLWTFSIYLEAVAILPQLVLLQRTSNIDNMTGNYIFLLGCVCAYVLVSETRHRHDTPLRVLRVGSGYLRGSRALIAAVLCSAVPHTTTLTACPPAPTAGRTVRCTSSTGCTATLWNRTTGSGWVRVVGGRLIRWVVVVVELLCFCNWSDTYTGHFCMERRFPHTVRSCPHCCYPTNSTHARTATIRSVDQRHRVDRAVPTPSTTTANPNQIFTLHPSHSVDQRHRADRTVR